MYTAGRLHGVVAAVISRILTDNLGILSYTLDLDYSINQIWLIDCRFRSLQTRFSDVTLIYTPNYATFRYNSMLIQFSLSTLTGLIPNRLGSVVHHTIRFICMKL